MKKIITKTMLILILLLIGITTSVSATETGLYFINPDLFWTLEKGASAGTLFDSVLKNGGTTNEVFESIEFEKGGIFNLTNKDELIGATINYEGSGKAALKTIKVTPATTNLDPGDYTDKLKVTFESGKTAESQITMRIIPPKPMFEIPTLKVIDFIYDGTEKIITVNDFDNFDSDNVFIVQGNKGMDAGSYKVIVHLKDPLNTLWTDNRSNLKSYEWEIKKKTETLSGQVFNGLEGQKLSNVALPTGWSWNNPDDLVEAGRNIYYASYTPSAEDEKNYNTVSNEEVVIDGIPAFSVKINVDNGITAPEELLYIIKKGESKSIDFTSKQDYFINSIKVNGVEQLISNATSHTIDINNISGNVVIDITSSNKNIFPIEGNSQIYEKGSMKKLDIKFDYAFNLFNLKSLKINSNIITEGFEFSEGSVILTLKSDLLEPLNVGTYNIEAELTTGEVMNASFEVKETENEEEVIQTGDNAPLVGIAILGVAAIIGIIALLIIKIKKLKNHEQ